MVDRGKTGKGKAALEYNLSGTMQVFLHGSET